MKYLADTSQMRCDYNKFPNVWEEEKARFKRMGLKFYNTKEEAIANLQVDEDFELDYVMQPGSCYLFIANDDMTFNSIQHIEFNNDIIEDEDIFEATTKTVTVLSVSERISKINDKITDLNSKINEYNKRKDIANDSKSKTKALRVQSINLSIEMIKLEIKKQQYKINKIKISEKIKKMNESIEYDNYINENYIVKYEEYIDDHDAGTEKYEVPTTAVLPESPHDAALGKFDKINKYVDYQMKNQGYYFVPGIKSVQRNIPKK